MSSKRRWWLKLEYIFFQDKAIKALRRKNPAAPDIYLKIMLRSLNSDCRMTFQKYGDTFADEIADDIDEDNTELIDDVIQFLQKHDLMIDEGNDIYYFPQAEEMTGSETDSAERMRRHRQKNNEASQSDNEASQCSVIRDRDRNREREEKESDTEADSDSVSALDSVKLSFDFIKRVCRENHVKITDADIRKYCDEMTAAAWKDSKGNVIQNIGAHIRTWLKYHSVDNGECEEHRAQPSETDKEVAFAKLREHFSGKDGRMRFELAMHNISFYIYGRDDSLSIATRQIISNKRPGYNSTAKEKSEYISWLYSYLTEEVCEIDICEDEMFCIDALKDAAPDLLLNGMTYDEMDEIFRAKLKGDYSGDFEEV